MTNSDPKLKFYLCYLLSSDFRSVFNFNSRKSKQNINYLLSLIKINFKNKQATKIFYLKSKLIQVHVKALPDWQLLHQVLEMQFCIVQNAKMQSYNIWNIIAHLQANSY